MPPPRRESRGWEKETMLRCCWVEDEEEWVLRRMEAAV